MEMKKNIRNLRRKLRAKKVKPIGYLTSPTRTHYAEVFMQDTEVLEQAFVYMLDDEKNKVIGRITALLSQWDKSGKSVEVYADMEIYGILSEKGKLSLKRQPLPPDTPVYKMHSDEVANLLAINEGMFIGKISETDTNVKIDPEKLLRGHTCLVGKTGSGKSWAVGCLLEEISKLDLPAIVIDPHGEYLSLAEPWEGSRDKKHLKALKKWDLEPQGFKLKVITANPEAKQLGQEYIEVLWPEETRGNQNPMVWYRRYGVLSYRSYTVGAEEQVVGEEDLPRLVDMYKKIHGVEPSITDGTYGDIVKRRETIEENPNLLDPDAMEPEPQYSYVIRKGDVDIGLTEIMEPGYITVIDLHNLDPDESRAVVEWLESKLFLLRKQRKISPFVNVIEEAHIFCPSEGKEWSSDAIMMLSKEARKFGMPVWFVTQRPVLLKTTVRANCENWIVLKITHPSDKASIIDACEGLDSNSSETIKNMPVGHAFLTGTIVEFPLVVQIRYRQSRHHYESGFRDKLQEYEKVEGDEEQ